MTFPIISNYLNISRTAEREPLEQRPQPAKLHETSIEQAPFGLHLLRPLPPLLAGQTRHCDALNLHVENYMLRSPAKLHKLRERVLAAFQSGTSYVSIDTSEVFPKHLCEAALSEIKAIRVKDAETNPGARKRSIALPAWARWMSQLKANVAQTEKKAFGGNARQELRVHTDRGAPAWHTDFGDLSSTVALIGPSTEFLPSIKADRNLRGMREEDVSQNAIQTVPTGHTLIFGGCLRPTALMHRSPPGSEERLVFVS